MCAQPKVVVKIESEEDMLVLQVSVFCLCVCVVVFGFLRLSGVTQTYSFLLTLVINIIESKLSLLN